MTAQPTTPMPPFGQQPQGAPRQDPVPGFPQGPAQPGPQEFGPQQFGPQQFGPQQFGPQEFRPQEFGPGFPPPFSPPAPPAAPRRSTGKVLALVAAAIVVLGGLGAGALFLFGSRTVEPESVQKEIVRITQTAVQVAPADVRCPAEIKAQAGGTFACTATVEGQPVTYNVRQDDDQGHLTITYDRLIKVGDLESTVADQLGKDIDIPVTVGCEPTGHTVLVNAPGTPIGCTATNKGDSADSAKITVTVAADGTPSYTFA